jgi:hypothetical protein
MPGKQVELLHSAVLISIYYESVVVVVGLTNLVFHPVVFNRRKRAASGYQRPALRPIVNVLGLRFVQSRRVAQWEHNRPLDMRGHLADCLLGKCLGLGRCADQHVRLYALDDVEEIGFVGCPFGVVFGVGDLRGC